MAFARLFFNPGTAMVGATVLNLAISNALHKNQQQAEPKTCCPDCKDTKQHVNNYQTLRPNR